jgi:hypothetical protein
MVMLQARRGLTGIMNYTNPGAISHNEILELYKSYIDPEFTWKNFSLEEQSKVIIAPRSNNLLDTARVNSTPSMYPSPKFNRLQQGFSAAEDRLIGCTDAIHTATTSGWQYNCWEQGVCLHCILLSLGVWVFGYSDHSRELGFCGLCAQWLASCLKRCPVLLQIEGEFPEILGIRESLIKHVFEPAALQVRPILPLSVQ